MPDERGHVGAERQLLQAGDVVLTTRPGLLRIDGVEEPVAAKVDIINDMVDPATRTVEIRLGVDNSGYAIRPGVFVQAEVRPTARYR